MSRRTAFTMVALAAALGVVLILALRKSPDRLPAPLNTPHPRANGPGEDSKPGLDPAPPASTPEAAPSDIAPPAKEKVSWARVPNAVKFACAGVFSSKLGPGHGYQYLCLDIGGQTRLLGMAKEETSGMLAQVGGLQKLDFAIMNWAGIQTPKEFSFDAIDVRDSELRADLTRRLVDVLDSDANGDLATRLASGTDLPFEWNGDALKTRALVLLGELDPDPVTLGAVRSLLDSKNPEHAAAAAVVLAKNGSVGEIAGRIEGAGPDLQAAFLAAFKWGTRGGGEIEYANGKTFGFTTNDPRVADAGLFLPLVRNLAESTRDERVRVAALDVLTQYWGEPGVLDILRQALQTSDSPEILNALMWNRQSYMFARDAAATARLMELSARGNDRLAVAATHRLCGSSDPAVIQYLIGQVRDATGAKLNAAIHALSVNGHLMRDEAARVLENKLRETTDKDLKEALYGAIQRLRS